MSVKDLLHARVVAEKEAEEGALGLNAAPSASSNSIEDALKRKEGILRAHQVRLEKLQEQNEALRDDLKREEHLRREADERAEQAQKELQVLANMHSGMVQPIPEEGLAPPPPRPSLGMIPRHDTFAEHGTTNEAELLQRVMEQRQAVQKAEDRNEALYAEMQVLRGLLSETQEKLEKSEEAKVELATKLEEATKDANPEKSTSAAPAAAPPAAANESIPDRRKRKPTDAEMEALLPAEAYRAMQDTRVESAKRITELEEQVAALKAIDGDAARMREKAAHQSMAERCAKVSESLRVVEGQLARTQALLNPTKVQLSRLQKEHLQLTNRYAELRQEADREARLRTAMASMALVGYGACYEAVLEVASLRAHVPPMPQESGFGSTLPVSTDEPPPPPPPPPAQLAPPVPPPYEVGANELDGAPARPSTRETQRASRPSTREGTRESMRPDHDLGAPSASSVTDITHGMGGLVLVEPPTIAALEEHAGSLDVTLQNAVLRIDELAPFNSPPPPHTPLTTIQQLCLLANQLPPPNPLPPLPLAGSLPSPAEATLAPLSVRPVQTKSVPKEYRPRQSASQPRLPSRCAGAQPAEQASAQVGSMELPSALSSSSLVPRAKGSIPSISAPAQGFVVSGVLHGGVQGAVVYNHLEPHKLSPTKRSGLSRQSKEESGAAEGLEPSRAAQPSPPIAALPHVHSHHRPASTPSINHPVKIQELLQAPYVRPSLQAEAPQSVPAHWGRHHTGRWGDPPAASGARARSNASPMRPGSKHLAASPKGHPLGFVAGQPPPAAIRGSSPPPSAIRMPG